MFIHNREIVLEDPNSTGSIFLDVPRLVTSHSNGVVSCPIQPGQVRYALPPGVRVEDIHRLWIKHE